MKSALFSTIGLLLSVILPTYAASLKGQYISQSYLANNTFYFDYSKMQDLMKINGGKNWALKLVDIPDHKVWLWDYAHNGAVVDTDLVARDDKDASFITQYDKFVESLYGKKALRTWASKTSLFAIWFGSNDIIYMNRSQGTSSTDVIDNILSTKFQKVQELYEHGARHFLFIYVPAIERSPLNKDNSLYFANADTTYYNNKVKTFASNFASTHPDTNVLVYDAYMEYNYIMDHKDEFGIENIADSCEDTGSKCDDKDSTFFWHDKIRPSVRVQEAVAQDIHEFLTSRQVNVRDEQFSGATSVKSFLFWNAILVLFSFLLF
ncbi:carbohydrate esterase family 16 protein [Piromyces sp. E2]|nr:carbohydrate esterase family 16 protein [Piromyces sp. E2]|eukprot:OUM56137.1 carbohydrate esterase family 16 protein [Piromyces sp. E2]